MIQIFLRSVSLCSLSNLSMNFLLSRNANFCPHFSIPSDLLFSPFWHTPLSNGTAKINPDFGSRKGYTLFFLIISEFLHVTACKYLNMKLLCYSISALLFLIVGPVKRSWNPSPTQVPPNSFWTKPESPKSIWQNHPYFKFSIPFLSQPPNDSRPRHPHLGFHTFIPYPCH